MLEWCKQRGWEGVIIKKIPYVNDVRLGQRARRQLFAVFEPLNLKREKTDFIFRKKGKH